jgi:hypothetical protein
MASVISNVFYFDNREYMAHVFWGINLIAIVGIFLFKKEK